MNKDNNIMIALLTLLLWTIFLAIILSTRIDSLHAQIDEANTEDTVRWYVTGYAGYTNANPYGICQPKGKRMYCTTAEYRRLVGDGFCGCGTLFYDNHQKLHLVEIDGREIAINQKWVNEVHTLG